MFKLDFKKKTNETKENLVKILNGKFKDIISDPELEIYTDGNDYTNYKFSEGDLLRTNLKEGKVIKVLDEMVLMSFNEGKKIINKWIWTSTSLKIIKAHKKEDEENSGVLTLHIGVGRAVHRSDTLQGQIVVHHREHTLLHLTTVPGVDDDLLAAGSVESNTSL